MTPKPCPFCGKQWPDTEIYAVQEEDGDYEGTWETWQMECESCGARGPTGDSETEAVRLWNAAPRGEE